jgi:hypothetical protein
VARVALWDGENPLMGERSNDALQLAAPGSVRQWL